MQEEKDLPVDEQLDGQFHPEKLEEIGQEVESSEQGTDLEASKAKPKRTIKGTQLNG
jgi:hypothetical protein